jgi:hypothetical protein
MPRSIVVSSSIAAIVSSCAVIDEPAPFVNRDGGAAATPSSPTAAFRRCGILDRQIATNVKARVYGDAPGPQAVCVTLELFSRAVAAGTLLFCAAGDLGKISAPRIRELTGDLQQCAYCTEVKTNCVPVDGGASVECANSYAVANPATARVRIVRLDRVVGGAVWIDLGDLEVARVTRREGASFDLEKSDCLFADGLTLQGVLERGSLTECSGIDETACAIARTAGSRVP